MLHILFGRAGTGKTTRILNQVRENGPRRQQIILVPEQVSHEMERNLCAVCGAESSRFGQILSFTRLAHRVISEAGGLAIPRLDGGGRLLLMSQAVSAVSDQLILYARPSRKAAFLEQLIATGDELKSYCISPDSLIAAGREQPGDAGERLHDLGLILGTYEALTAQGLRDPRETLTQLSETLLRCHWFRGKDVYLDSFTDFTPQQKLVLIRILEQANSVTVALTCDRLEGESEIPFLPARRTAMALMELCRKEGFPLEYEGLTEVQRPYTPAIAALEQGLFGSFDSACESTEGLSLHTAPSPYDEVEWAAGKILSLVRENRWHFRDIAVSARTMDRYERLLESIFQRYEIPLFLGRVEPILEKPILSLLVSALDVVRNRYEYEDVFRYLKTGLTGIDSDDVDLLENYVLRWEIRGSRWTRAEDWSWHPQGYALPWTDGDRETLAHLNKLRRQVTEPLSALDACKEGTGAELARILYRFLESIELPLRLKERSEELREQGQLQQAEEYRQLWQIVLTALEQCHDLLSERVMEMDYFSDLFRLVLSQYSVSSIPVSLDRVNGGEIARLSHCKCKAMIVLGVDDEQFPLISQSPGLLTDEDRVFLTGRGMELSPTADLRLDREQTMAYDAFTRADRLLILSRPGAVNGAQRQPAVLWERIERYFPDSVHEGEDLSRRLLAPLPALELAAGRGDDALLSALSKNETWGQWIERVRSARRMNRGMLTPQAVEKLYGTQVALSASKMDKLKSCHFAYFLQYGIKAKPRKRAGFDAPETGTFVHYILEHVLMSAGEEGGIAVLTDERREELVQHWIGVYIKEELGELQDQTPRFTYLFRRMTRSVSIIMKNVADELKSGSFQPLAFELGFGRNEELAPVQIEVGDITLSISGFVDRVDGWEKDGTLYLRVVDYKTGKKSFKLTDVWHGLSLQMLLYLFTLKERGEDYFGKPIVPAGVLYLPARDVLLSGERDMDEDARRKETDKLLRRSGLLLNDTDVLQAMEQWGDGAPRFLPLRVSRTGTVSGESLATAEQWGRLERRLELLLQEMGHEIAAGNVNADPYRKGPTECACDYCDYASACHFEEGHGTDSSRYLYKVDGSEFWEKADQLNDEQEKKVNL